MWSRGIFLSLVFLMLVSCSVVKDIFKQKSSRESIDTSDTTIIKYERINADWIRINESILRRDGMLTITFDSITSVIVLPDHTVKAVGYNPRIESTKTEIKNLNIRDSLKVEKVDSTQATGSKKKLESESEESSSRKVTKTPSLTPWIGAGLAIAIVVLAVLHYFFRRR